VGIAFRHWLTCTLCIVALLCVTVGVAAARVPIITEASSVKLVTLGHGVTVRLVRTQPVAPRVVRLQALARHVPSIGAVRPSGIGVIPFRTRFNAATWSAIKQRAAHNVAAPIDRRSGFSTFTAGGAASWAPFLRVTGMTDNGLICGYFGTGCQPPDMAVAASPNWTIQFVNTSIAIFDKHGVMVLGFPIDAPTFFGIPNPGSCTPFGVPFTTDPRAFWDPNDHRFFLAIGAHNGVADSCPFSSNFYVAVSQTSDPTGLWNIYVFNADPLGIGAFGDFTRLGFDSKAVYISMNSFPVTSSGFSTCPIGYCWSQTLIADKAAMEAGAAVPAPNLFFDPTNVGGFPLDSVQAVETIAPLGQQPGATPLISSDNFFGPTGAGCFPTPCNLLYVFGISKPLSATPTLSAQVVTSPLGWTYPPSADEPGCGGCVATNDSRIDGTPIYSPYNGGTVSFALNTGVRIGTLTWPSNLWGELSITTSGGKITGASVTQSGYIDAVGVSNSFADTMLTPSGRLYVVSDVMSPTIYPSWEYRLRLPGDAANTLRAPVVVQPGLDSYFPQFGIPGFGNLRWGDYEASSYTGVADDHVWLASQYPNTDYDWGTSMAEVK
jgi:hypothetical protein